MRYVLQGQSNGGKMMTQDERLDYLLKYLLSEREGYEDIRVPDKLVVTVPALSWQRKTACTV